MVSRTRTLVRRLILTGCILSFASCESYLIGPDPENTPEHNFEMLWSEFDRLYALFDVKNVDWEALYSTYRPQVKPGTTDAELFKIITGMLRHLNDGHVTLSTPYESFSSNSDRWDSPTYFNLNLIRTEYLGNSFGTTKDGRVTYGKLPGGYGYIHIARFDGDARLTTSPVNGWARDVDAIVESFRDLKGIIVDVRNNGGGNGFNGQFIAGRFADRSRVFLISRTRNGPRYDNFTSPTSWYVEPRGTWQFTRPTVVLTNHFSFSATEWFTLAMRTLPHVRVIGDTTGGGLSERLPRQLPNGWIYSISIQNNTSADGTSYEGKGVPPDVTVRMSLSDIRNRRDPVIEAAVKDILARQ